MSDISSKIERSCVLGFGSGKAGVSKMIGARGTRLGCYSAAFLKVPDWDRKSP